MTGKLKMVKDMITTDVETIVAVSAAAAAGAVIIAKAVTVFRGDRINSVVGLEYIDGTVFRMITKSGRCYSAPLLKGDEES